jgi:signal transduction histidine kinase
LDASVARTVTRSSSRRGAPRPARAAERQPLVRPRDCVLGGVSVAVARHLGWSVDATRWLAVGLTLCGGAGILLYAWLWALTPLEPAAPGAQGVVHRRVSVPWVLFALAATCGVVVLALGGGFRGGTVAAASVLPALTAAIVFGAGAVAWDQLIDATAPRTRAAARTLRVASGVVLVAVGILAPLAWSESAPGWLWVLFVVTALAGVAVLIAPLALRLWRELIAERTTRVREEERAVIAAHLHDSVLQTLALIQTKAGASSEVARLARAQERELRDWLYSGQRSVDSDLVSDLRDAAAALELDYPVRFDVVAAGLDAVGTSGEHSSPSPSHAPPHGARVPDAPWAQAELAAASREAMLNAARHAGGDVSVYIEGSATATEVYVRDRGPGFALADVPSDRMGVRESIVGRMRRAGGTASVGAGAGGVGTEVRLHLVRATDDEGEGDA